MIKCLSPRRSEDVTHSVVRRALGVHAAFAAFAAAVHLVWQWTAPALPELAGLTGAQADVLRVLNGAVVLTLSGLTALSVAGALPQTTSDRQARGLAVAVGCFWLGRAGLELLYPVQVPVLGPHTSPTILALSSLAGGGLILASLYSRYMTSVRRTTLRPATTGAP